MAKPNKIIPIKVPVVPKEQPALLGESKLYRVKKYGLYRYQVLSVDPISGAETKLGEENVYGIVASDLIDRIFNDINPEHSK